MCGKELGPDLRSDPARPLRSIDHALARRFSEGGSPAHRRTALVISLARRLVTS
jgi:hypothetical protein